jgi:hypothetical protein
VGETSVSQAPASTKAVLSLVFGILAFFGLPCVGSIVAIVLGKGERSGVGRAGFVLGWIGLVLGLLVAILVAIWLLALPAVISGQ